MASRETRTTDAPLIVIVGPTASGKTGLAIELAKKYNGEIICADSRTVYRYMDIGTAKPSPVEQLEVPHWGLDLVEPGERFTAADFKRYATDKIAEIRRRGHVPFLVGGTGLYIDAIVFDYQFDSHYDPKLREKLASMSIPDLHNYCLENNIRLPENDKNKRYIIRTIERKSISTKRKNEPIENSIIVGITTDVNELKQRIAMRTEQLFKDNVVNEAIKVGEKYGWDSEAMTGNIYRLAKEYRDNQITLEEYREKFKILDWRLAKRQRTWLKRNPLIEWFDLAAANNYLSKRLAK